MATKKDFSARVNQLIGLADATLATTVQPSGIGFSSVSGELFHEFRASSLSFIRNVYGENHPYYRDFNSRVVHDNPYDTQEGRGILRGIKTEIDSGWLVTLKGVVSAEIFSSFLEMSEHLLQEKYKDAAAVMIGGVLEEHLRQLCNKYGIPTDENKGGKSVPKKADLLNAELAAKGIYNKLDQKSVTAWLDLRNKAAHGKYSEYTHEQVELMLQSVTDFMSRNAI